MWKGLIVATLALADTVSAYIHPITVEGHYFIDSVTKEPVSYSLEACYNRDIY